MAACREPPPYEPAAGVQVHHYDVELVLAPGSAHLRGTTTLHVTYPDTVGSLSFSFGRLNIDSVLVNGERIESTHRGRRLEVPVPDAHVDTLYVTVAYTGRVREGIYTESHKGHQVLFSDGWPERIRGWLPGSHHPSDPATLSLTITHPLGNEVAASGQLVERDTLNGDVRSHFHLEPAAPTYAFAFAKGNYTVMTDTASWNGRQWPVRSYLLNSNGDQVDVLERIPQALALFSELVGPYPYAEYASVQVPFRYAGMENASAAFVQADLFRMQQAEAISLYHAEAVAVHELAHQWFGNHISLNEWRDLWLSEGMATYLTTVFFEQVDGEETAHVLRAQLAEVDRPARWRGPLVPESEVAPNRHLSPVVYNRGACVLHLLRLYVGDAAFFGALQAIYQQYGAVPLSTPAFREVMEAELGADLSEFFHTWVYGTELPVLRTNWDTETGTLRWEVEGGGPWLSESPVLLEVSQGNEVKYVPLQEGKLVMQPTTPRPEIRPVGVMIHIR